MLSTIRQGSTGDIVKAAQYLTGYSNIKEANGIYDVVFFEHIKNWQAINGLDDDGIIGPKTWTKISEKALTCSTSKNRKSVYTCAVQVLLGGLNVDGIYGPKTKNAVAAYQASSKLSTDGICGPKTWKSLICGSNSQSGESSVSSGTSGGASQTDVNGKILNRCVHYLQWDSRWKNIKYSTHTSSQTIGNSGCGTTSMAMIVATWIDPKITPVEMSKLSVDNGYRTYNNGTAWGFFPFVFKKYDGFTKYISTTSVSTLKSALKEGALAVCSMNSNDNHFWTSGGHYIVAIGYDNDGYIYANDPNKSSAPRKQKQDKFQSCLKQAFIFWPKELEATNYEKKEQKKEERKEEVKNDTKVEIRGTEIIDISKWQGNIDFDALKNKVAFVIVRASCGSDKDVKFDEYANAMNSREIPFGVYCYSYAGTVEKAIDEVKKMINYASQYSPLFYVMDAEESRLTNATIKAFAEELKKQKARKTGCYVANHRYNEYKYDSIRDLFDFTWIPKYGKNDGTIEGSSKPTYKCDLWQYTSTGKIDGIKGNVDKNTITGDGHDLNWFVS